MKISLDNLQKFTIETKENSPLRRDSFVYYIMKKIT